MKRKDIMQLILAGVLFTVLGIFLLGQFDVGTRERVYEPEQVYVIEPEFDEAALDILRSGNRVEDFTVRFNLDSGIGRTNPFSN